VFVVNAIVFLFAIGNYPLLLLLAITEWIELDGLSRNRLSGSLISLCTYWGHNYRREGIARELASLMEPKRAMGLGNVNETSHSPNTVFNL